MNAKDIVDYMNGWANALREYREKNGEVDYKLSLLEQNIANTRDNFTAFILRETAIAAPKMVTPKIK